MKKIQLNSLLVGPGSRSKPAHSRSSASLAQIIENKGNPTNRKLSMSRFLTSLKLTEKAKLLKTKELRK